MKILVEEGILHSTEDSEEVEQNDGEGAQRVEVVEIESERVGNEISDTDCFFKFPDR